MAAATINLKSRLAQRIFEKRYAAHFSTSESISPMPY